MTDYIPAYMKESPPPPEIKEGEEVLATIDKIEIDTKGTYGAQYRFDCTLDDFKNFPAKAWLRYYETPGHKSYLGMLCLKIENVTEVRYDSLDAAMQALKNKIGKIYLRCSGHRTTEGTTFPKLKVVTGRLPPVQVPLGSKTVEEPVGEEAVITRILATIPQLTKPAIEKMIAAEVSKGIPRQAASFIVASNLGVTVS